MIIVPNSAVVITSDEGLPVRVVKVFDGDGFMASIPHPTDRSKRKDFAFRFAFIDAPETDQFFGGQSQAFLSDLILNKTITVISIYKESSPTIPLDSYQRLLCMGFLEEEMPAGQITYFWNGEAGVGRLGRRRSIIRNVELEMLVNGFAWVLPRYSFEWKAEYMSAQDDARRSRRGLWARNNPEPPWKFKARRRRRMPVAGGQVSLL